MITIRIKLSTAKTVIVWSIIVAAFAGLMALFAVTPHP